MTSAFSRKIYILFRKKKQTKREKEAWIRNERITSPNTLIPHFWYCFATGPHIWWYIKKFIKKPFTNFSSWKQKTFFFKIDAPPTSSWAFPEPRPQFRNVGNSFYCWLSTRNPRDFVFSFNSHRFKKLFLCSPYKIIQIQSPIMYEYIFRKIYPVCLAFILCLIKVCRSNIINIIFI